MLFSQEIRKRIPNSICLVTSEDDIATDPTHYEVEEQYIANAVPKRRTEFRQGRQCAREALRFLGAAPCPIPAGNAREPVWPVGYVGSITHCSGFCAAAAAENTKYTAIGIDIEEKKHLSFDIASQVLTETEKAGFNLDDPVDHLALLVFSAKESIFKCVYPLTKRYMDFLDVSVEIDQKKMRFNAEIPGITGSSKPQNTIEGIYIMGDRYIFTLACI
jgi:enterobactin synthetase component D